MTGTQLEVPLPALQTGDQLARLLGVPFSQEQLAALTAPLQPGVIVAGAGSGKTAVMAARVVWLVGTGQVRPDQVLGLTFTNKAAGELLARVRAALARLGTAAGTQAAVGATEAALDPTVSTYHAYAGRLLAEHGLRLGLEPAARLLAEPSRHQLAARVLRRTRRPVGSLTRSFRTLTTDLLALDAELAEHLCDPEELREHDRALVAEVEGLAKAPADVRVLADTARARIELSALVEEYRAAKRAAEVVDFGDQMAFAARLAEDCPEVGAGERDVFRVVLLDEYQDTSVAQRRMLVGLFGGGHPVTAVGDPCQAIYGWRGASVGNLDGFGRHFPLPGGGEAPTYRLTVNRRSGGRVLRVANDVAGPLRRLHPQVAELSPADGQEDTGLLRCALLETAAQEWEWLADRVAEEVGAGRRPGEVAVLCRVSRDFLPVRDALVARGLPVEVVGLGGLLSCPDVADVVATLEVISDPTANPSLVRLLAGPRWRIGPRDLALLGRRAAELVRVPGLLGAPSGLDGHEVTGPDPLEEAVAGSDPAELVALLDAVEHPGPLPYSAAARERFARLARELRALRRHVGESVAELAARAVEASGLDVEVSVVAEDRGRGREDLDAFLDLAAGFADLDGSSSLPAFLAFLHAASDADASLDPAAPSESDAVKVLTVHRAKGLEWPVVALPGLVAGVFPAGTVRDRWTRNPQVLPYPLRGDADDLPTLDDLTGKGVKAFDADCRSHGLAEERRLGYVALTRPKQVLLASGHWWGPEQTRPRGPSEFLEAVRRHCQAGAGPVDVWADEPEADAVNPALGQRVEVVWPVPDGPVEQTRAAGAELVRAALADPEGSSFTDERLAGDLHDDTLSAAERAWLAGVDRDLHTVLGELRERRAPERDVLLPTTLTASQVLALARDPQTLARGLRRPMPRPPAASARRGTRFHAWVEGRFGQQPLLEPDDLPGAADAEVLDDADLEALKEAFARSAYADERPVAVEEPFALLLAGRVVRGRIDAVYRRGGRWEVVDWKTGRGEADPLQLAVYRLAWAERVGVPPEEVDAVFLHVRDGRVERPELPAPAELVALLASGPAPGADDD